jgi:acyl carrier protein
MNERLRTLLARVFRVPPESISPETVQADIAAWDSQGHLDLIMRFEAEFGVELELHEVLRMRSVREIAAVLADRGALTAA